MAYNCGLIDAAAITALTAAVVESDDAVAAALAAAGAALSQTFNESKSNNN